MNLDAVRGALADDLTIDIVTTGARSGQQRETEIWFLNVGGRIVITGTPGRRDWLANLGANPEFTFRLKESVDAELPARATPITDPELRRTILNGTSARWYREQTDLDHLVDEAPLVEVRFTGWAAALNATPTVTAIHIAPASRLPTKPVDSVEAEAGAGLVGDRYHGTKHRHVTVQSQTELDEASARLGQTIDPEATRRNVTISHGDVPLGPGSRITIGDVELEVVRKAAPCKLLDDGIGPGAAKALHDRAGAVCRLLTSGTISVGDDVTLRLEI